MLSKGLKVSFGVGIVLVLIALGLHEVLRYYNASAAVEFGLLNLFVATFASMILTFFIGALLFDYQLETTKARRDEQLRALVLAELTGISEGLDLANATKIRPSDDPAAEVVITHLHPMVVEEAVQSGFFDPSQAERALRLARNIRTYNARVSYLLSILFSGKTGEPDFEQLVLHAIERIEETRRAAVEDARLLAIELQFEVRNSLPAAGRRVAGSGADKQL